MKKNSLSLFLAVCLLATSGWGCYGRFELTRKLYGWNGQVTNNKFANSAIMWAMLIIPVYGVAGIIDLVVLNTMEVLTGRNPVASAEGGKVEVRHAGRHLLLETDAQGRVEVREGDEVVLRYRQQGDRVLVWDAQDRLIKTLPVPTALAQGKQ